MSCWESESVHWMGCVARVGDWDSIEWMVGLSAMMRDSDSRVVFCCCCCCSVMIDGWCHEEDVVRLVTVVAVMCVMKGNLPWWVVLVAT